MRAAEDQRSGGDSPLWNGRSHIGGRATDGSLSDRRVGERLVAFAHVATAQHLLLAAEEVYDAALPSNGPRGGARPRERHSEFLA